MAQVLTSQAMGENDFKRIIAVQRREILVKNERLKGVEDLVRICSEKEEKLQGWKTRAENYETALRRVQSQSCCYAQFIATRIYVHFMCAYVYLHLHLFVIPLIFIEIRRILNF